jgi:hypothetical protein
MSGKLDPVIEALMDHDRQEQRQLMGTVE